MRSKASNVEKNSGDAAARFAELGVDVTKAFEQLSSIPISMQCWQGDDVTGFEGRGEALSGGIAVTGSFLGRARTAEELRFDLDVALKLLPGSKRLNLHASYGDFGGKRVDRDEIEASHFKAWADWASERKMGLDFNPTYFSHPKASSGFTLAHPDQAIRKFWIEHGRRCREIGASFGRRLGTPCVTNFWIPDGFKDTPVDRTKPRERLIDSLDAVFEKRIQPRLNLDAVEGKLFGIGSESYVVGSHEFYFGYAVSRQKLLCLDAGHYHPTESIADKISSTLPYLPGILLHVSRGVRWDSDHVVTLTDDLQLIADEIVRSGQAERIHIGLDFFDASINRVAAWIIGVRSIQQALLRALLKPWKNLEEAEESGDFTSRLALQEEIKALPYGTAWDRFCARENVPRGLEWLAEVKRYERDVLSRRS